MKILKPLLLMIALLLLLFSANGCSAADLPPFEIPEDADSPGRDDAPPLFEISEDAYSLGRDGDTWCFWRFEEDDCVLYAVEEHAAEAKRLAAFPPYDKWEYGGSVYITRNYIVDFGICGDWLILSVGTYQGSGHIFYGDFVRLKKDGGILEHFWLTDDDRFVIVGDWIYYNFWMLEYGRAEGKEGVYRIRPDGTDKEDWRDKLEKIYLYVEDGDGYVYGGYDTGKTIIAWNTLSDLIRCRTDGTEQATLFQGESLPEFDNSDYMDYYHIETTEEFILFSVYVQGYSPGDGVRGHILYDADYRVNKDGGDLTLLREKYFY